MLCERILSTVDLL